MVLQSLNFAFNMVLDATGIFILKKRKKWNTHTIDYVFNSNEIRRTCFENKKL